MTRRYFLDSEFQCKCCGVEKMQPCLINALDLARDFANIPFVINSGYRCEAHNERVGGKKESAHTIGWAVDIRVRNSRERYLVVMGLTRAGFHRIGIADTFVHADLDPDKPKQVIWNY